LHGGATSTLIDYFTTYAIMSLDDGRHPGVSVELNVSFLSAYDIEERRGEERRA